MKGESINRHRVGDVKDLDPNHPNHLEIPHRVQTVDLQTPPANIRVGGDGGCHIEVIVDIDRFLFI